MKEKRSNVGFEIIFAEQYYTYYLYDGGVQKAEIVLGHNPKSCTPFVVWNCFNGTDYEWGHYFTKQDEAQKFYHEKLAAMYTQQARKHEYNAERMAEMIWKREQTE